MKYDLQKLTSAQYLKRGVRSSFSGFTIVELLIVIVIIGILAALVIVAYTGIQQRADNAARQNEELAWKRIFMTYQSQNGQWPPAMTQGSFYCLGTGFPIGAGGVARCRDYQTTTTGYLESDNATLMNQLKTVATLPTSKKVALGTTVGPYVNLNTSDVVTITQVFPISIGTCPNGTALQWTGTDKLWCEVRLQP